jgi:hypothetical protein
VAVHSAILAAAAAAQAATLRTPIIVLKKEQLIQSLLALAARVEIAKAKAIAAATHLSIPLPQ